MQRLPGSSGKVGAAADVFNVARARVTNGLNEQRSVDSYCYQEPLSVAHRLGYIETAGHADGVYAYGCDLEGNEVPPCELSTLTPIESLGWSDDTVYSHDPGSI